MTTNPGVPGDSVPAMNARDEKPEPLLKDPRVRGVIAAAAVAGFLVGMVFFGEPWHLPPAWGDVPTWLLAAGAAITAWLALMQLRDLREWIAKEAVRNSKRDQLLDKQIAEAGRREESERRRLVEDVEVTFSGKTGYVANASKRPLNDVTCGVMSKVDRNSLASPDRCGEVAPGPGGGGWMFLPGSKEVSRFEVLRPGASCGFSFESSHRDPDCVLVAWFTDDDGFRWQLDEYQHLTRSEDESVYLPLKVPRPLPPGAPGTVGGAAPESQAPDPAGFPALGRRSDATD